MIPFSDLPPEVQEQIKKQHEHMQMQADDYRHRCISLFNELSEDQLITLRDLIHAVNMNAEESTLGLFYEGQITMALSYRFGVCPPCGIDHDKAAAEFLADAAKESEQLPLPLEEDTDALLIGELPEDDGTFAAAVKAVEDSLTPAEKAARDADLMQEYGLEFFHPEDEKAHNPARLRCVGCKVEYPSLQDRMLNSPAADGCSGCVQNTKWGGPHR